MHSRHIAALQSAVLAHRTLKYGSLRASTAPCTALAYVPTRQLGDS
jgi:hypothetical protein